MILVELGRSLRRLRGWLVIILCEQTAAIVHHNCTRGPSLKDIIIRMGFLAKQTDITHNHPQNQLT